MIVSFTNRFIFIAVPRTASTSTYRAIQTAGAHQVLYRQAPNPCYAGDSNGFHDPFVPSELAAYFTFTNCRNPYSRMVSHYLFAKSDPSHRLHSLASIGDFSHYVEIVTMGRLLTTQTQFLGDTRIDARIVVEENVEFQLRGLSCLAGIDVQVGLANVSTSDRPWYAYYDKATIEAVRTWAAADFERLEYSTDFGDAVEGKGPGWYYKTGQGE
jgi:hypothetical protein